MLNKSEICSKHCHHITIITATWLKAGRFYAKGLPFYIFSLLYTIQCDHIFKNYCIVLVKYGQ